MTDPFAPALAHVTPDTSPVYGPASFQEYLGHHGITHKDTAGAISVDFLERLSPALRAANVMVLRTGQGQFALVAPPSGLGDFFLHDDAIFGNDHPEPYNEPIDPEVMRPYLVMPKLTETSLVNLAFATGLIGHALGLDPPYPTAAPATGSTTYTFSFRPHSGMTQVLQHTSGQVEIDAVFIGRRAGAAHIFVLEAKSDTKYRTLAKHKVVYPLLALAKAPFVGDLHLVPVYLKMTSRKGGVDYHVTECRFPDPRQGVPALDELEPIRHRYLSISF